MAADSQESDEGHGAYYKTEKIFRKSLKQGRKKYECLIGTAGESYSGMLFVDWFPGIHQMLGIVERPPLPKALEEFESDFLCIILDHSGLYTCDRYLRPIKILEKFAAIGSGTKLALAAMDMGASAAKAVEIACKYDLYSRPPIVTERLR